MTTNPFFSSNFFADQKDQKLLQDLITESHQIYGIDCLYVPREFVRKDSLFGEDQSSSFEKTYPIELYVKTVDSFGGDGKFLSRFGIEIRDEITFSVSIPRFEEEILANEPDMKRPMEGDLISVQSAIDKRSRLFEVTYVNAEEVNYQLGKLYTWELRTKVFELGGESFDTGVESIDSISEFKVTETFELTNGSGDFVEGELVNILGTGNTATVKSWDSLTQTLEVFDIIGEFEEGTIVGGAASWDIQFKVSEAGTNSLTDNDFIEARKIDFIDFSETNPFSE